MGEKRWVTGPRRSREDVGRGWPRGSCATERDELWWGGGTTSTSPGRWGTSGETFPYGRGAMLRRRAARGRGGKEVETNNGDDHPLAWGRRRSQRGFWVYFLLLKGLTSPPGSPWPPTVGGEDVAEDGPQLPVGGETFHHLLHAARRQPAEGAEPRQQPRTAQQSGHRPGDHLQDAHQHRPSADALPGAGGERY